MGWLLGTLMAVGGAGFCAISVYVLSYVLVHYPSGEPGFHTMSSGMLWDRINSVLTLPLMQTPGKVVPTEPVVCLAKCNSIKKKNPKTEKH